MIKKFLMMCIAAISAMVAWADFVCSAEVGAVLSGSVNREGAVTWKNTGSTGVSAPYVRITAGDGVLIRLTDADAWGKSIEFLATSASSPASMLKAGEEGSLVFLCQSESDDGKLELSWTLSSAEAFPWSELGASLKPSYVSQDAWTFALSTLKTRFGTTWDTYLTRLRANADYLAGLGRPVNRIDRLMQIEIGRALGVDAALPVLDSVTDAARSARGLSLAFSRTYSSAMYSRFTSGILGYGWTDNYSAYAELTDDKTLVFRLPGGGSYSFTKETGSWQPEDARDKTALTESSSAYTLTYQNGTVQTFAKSNMRIASIADNSGNAVTFTWNGTNLTKATHTDGQSLIFDYSNGLLSSVTDDCGRKTQYTYSNSLLTKVISPDGLTVSYEYRPVDNTAVSRALSRIVYPDGTTREFTYDTSSGLVSEVSVNGGKEKTTIARTDSVVTLTSVDGAVTTIKTGVSGEVLETVDALGGVTAREYTEDGLLKAIVSPSGLTGSILHDTLGRVSKSVSATGTETAFLYESTFGNLKTVTDAKNHAITYGYDSKGRGTSVSFVDGSSSKLEYNDRGDIVKSTNRRGESISYQYDSKGRLTRKAWSNGRTFTFEYDARGNVTEAADSATGTVRMEYDSADRVTRIMYPTGRGFTFAYDSCGRLSVRTSHDGAAEHFSYDASGRLDSVSDGNGTVYLSNTYDATTGRLTRQSNGNGTSVSYLYDKLGRVVSIEHCDADGKIVESLQYCYDADGRCIRASSLFGEERYGYDNDGQLTSVEYPDDTEEAFVYDAVGNRVSRTGGSPAENETYAVSNLNQYTEIVNAQAARSTMTYDRDGNMTAMTDSQGTTRYYYDTLNRLVAVTNATKNIRWSCVYDVFGNRVSVTDNGVTTERTYLQGSLPSVAAEYVNGQLKERHIVVGAVRVADLITNHSSLTTKYYHADLIGSTRLVTDGNGDIVNRCAYKAFGETRIGEESVCGYVGTLGVETDSTGLLFMRNRYYSPSLGRFIQMDPIGLNGEDVNLYRYCENNPIVGIDPNGEFVITAAGAIAFAAKAFLAYGYTKIIFDSIEEVCDLLINGDFDKQQWMENAASLIIGGSIGKGAFAEPMKKAGKKAGKTLIPISVKMANNWRVATVAKKYMPYLARDAVPSLMAKMVVNEMPVESPVVIPISTSGGSGSINGGGNSGAGGGGGGAIMNESDWLDIATNKNAKTATYSLGADITFLNPKSIISGFKGKFVGNGFKLTVGTGKNIFSSADGAHFTGAFTLDGALVGRAENCTFDNCTVTGDFTDGGSGNGTGGLANYAKNCQFIDCSAAGKVISSNEAVGGLVGEAVECSFENCSSSASVTGAYFVGGIVGDASNCSFSESCAAGEVTAAGWSGGFVGDAIESAFTKCWSSGTVVGQPSLADDSSSYSWRIGGFAGHAEDACSFTDCYSTATVNAPDDNSAGGFVGHVDGDSSVVTFKRCYATGSVTGKTEVGGFVGVLTGCSLEDCYSKSITTAVGELFSGGITKAQVGGFFGNVGTSKKASLTRCYALGKVNAPASSGLISWIYAGGFSWYQDYITSADFPDMVCTDCYWDASGTGQSKSVFGKSLSASQINTKIASVTWYADSAELTLAKNINSANYNGDFSQKSVLLSLDSSFTPTSSLNIPRLYCYERYVAVAGYAYKFNLSTEAEASITVSGLPKGLVYSNGIISGTPIRSETSILTITARFSNSIQTKNVPFVVIETPEDMILPGVSVIVDERCEGWGEVSGSMIASPGTQVALRAMANNGYIFAGWYMMDGLPFNGLVDYRTPNLVYEVTEKHITLVARFVQSANDVASVMFELPNELSTGVPIEPVAIDVSGCTSLPTVKVTGLPEGLKFTAKDVFKTDSKTEVEYPANTIYGTPTKSGVYTIAATVTTAGKKMATYSQTVIVRMDGEKVVVAECDAIGGKVTGGGVYAEGKSAALKATANKGYVFAGWYEDNAFTTPCDSTLADYRNPSYAYTMGADDKTLHARFELVEADTNLSLTVDGVAITLEDSPFNSFTVGSATNLPIVLDSFSLPKAAVKGLPAGMKYTEKPIFVKGSKTEIETPANSIYGAPTKPGVYKVSVSLTNTSIKKAVVNEFDIVVPNLMDDLIVVDDEYGPYVPGVAYTNTISAAAGCAVTGLPAGMKWTAKDILDSKTKQVAVSANSAYGVPTKPGKYTVYFTKTVDNVKHTATATFVVGDFPVVDVEIIGNGTGKVTGAGAFAANKKVTLKATADTKDDAKKGTKKSVFAGWYLDQNGDHPVVSSVDFRTPSLSYVMTAEPQTRLYAKFVTAEEDAASIALSVDALGGAISPEAIVSVTNTCGVALKWSVAADALSQPLVAVSGLPAGLKFTAKDIMKTGSKTEVEIPANTIYGAPTAASKIDKKTGLPIPSVVKITVTTASKSSVTYLVNIVVDSLPAWAVGNFEGFVRHDEDDGGFASMSVTTAGKISGKIAYGGTNWTFKAASYDIASETVDYTNFAVKAVAASGKATLDFSLAITKDGVDYLPDSAVAFGDGNFGDMPAEMHRLPWKDKNDTDAAALIASYAGAYSCKVPYGRDAAGVTFVLDEKGAVKGTVVLPDGTKTRKATFSCNVLPNYDSFSVVIALPPDLKKGYPAVFKIVELVNCSGKGSDGMAYRDPGVIVNVDEYFTGSGATGTVSVSPKYGQVSSGKSVTITAKPAKGSVFHCWKIKGVGTDGLNLTEPTLKFVMPGESDVYATAVFATVEDDIVSFSLDVPPSRMVEPGGMFLINLTDYVNSLSRPQVTVKGLPSSLKYDPKTMTISGSITKNGKYTVMLTGTNASVTGKNAIVGEFVIIVQESEVDTKYTSISDFEWVYTSCGVEITSYLGDDYNVNIPPIIDNLPVVSIGGWSFFGCASLESVHIPDSVTSIGVGAFDDCPCLVSINIPKGVSVIEGCLFSKCHSLESIVIPEGVTSIGESAFYHCTSLTELVIPNSVTNIDSCAFAMCSSLVEVFFEGDAPVLEDSVFYDVNENCTAYVRPGSIGWGVSIPGVWNNIYINYEALR